eukprot:TRINITY_DN28083_c0_g1_i1.p1 TRINITY_DN28083_c0_g1~~TRINITY_DN28083_c0_g1_i1.p1  ORF type:complete len:108 (-),score=4.58 TRINITY_DN28083_c0_g1_i1:188-511(-)
MCVEGTLDPRPSALRLAAPDLRHLHIPLQNFSDGEWVLHGSLPTPCAMFQTPRSVNAPAAVTSTRGIATENILSPGTFMCVNFLIDCNASCCFRICKMAGSVIATRG